MTQPDRRRSDDQNGSAEPRTLPGLLRLLGVGDMPVAKQWNPIMGWLIDNQPSRDLWMSLLANGYALPLQRMLPGSGRRKPYRRTS
jgi:hypothetical protein